MNMKVFMAMVSYSIIHTANSFAGAWVPLVAMQFLLS